MVKLKESALNRLYRTGCENNLMISIITNAIGNAIIKHKQVKGEMDDWLYIDLPRAVFEKLINQGYLYPSEVKFSKDKRKKNENTSL